MKIMAEKSSTPHGPKPGKAIFSFWQGIVESVLRMAAVVVSAK